MGIEPQQRLVGFQSLVGRGRVGTRSLLIESAEIEMGADEFGRQGDSVSKRLLRGLRFTPRGVDHSLEVVEPWIFWELRECAAEKFSRFGEPVCLDHLGNARQQRLEARGAVKHRCPKECRKQETCRGEETPVPPLHKTGTQSLPLRRSRLFSSCCHFRSHSILPFLTLPSKPNACKIVRHAPADIRGKRVTESGRPGAWAVNRSPQSATIPGFSL